MAGDNKKLTDEQEETAAPVSAPATEEPDESGTSFLDGLSSPVAGAPGGDTQKTPEQDEESTSLLNAASKRQQAEQRDTNLGVFAKSLPGATARGVGMTAGARIGGAVGFAAPPPAWPITVPAGIIIGGLGGLWAGSVAEDELVRRDLAVHFKDVPPEQKPIAVAGEVLAGGIGVSAGVQTLARLPGRLPQTAVGNVINRVLDTAKNRPFWYNFKEGTALTTAAGAEAAYEALRPNHPWERAGVGLVAGAVNPIDLVVSNLGRAVLGAGRWAWNHTAAPGLAVLEPQLAPGGFMRNVVSGLRQLTPDKRQDAVIEALGRAFEASKDDPRAMLLMLQEARELGLSIPGFVEGSTAAMATGSKRLAEIEANLAQLDQAFFGSRARASQEANKAIANAIHILQGYGSPEALNIAARLRYERYSATLKRLETYAMREAVDAADTITKGATQGDKAVLSRTVTDIYEKALKDARDVEGELWEAALKDKSLPGSFNAVFRTHSALRKEMLDSETLPKIIEEELQRISSARKLLKAVDAGATELTDGTSITAGAISKAKEMLSVGELMKLRTRLLALGRGAARSTDENADTAARQYGIMAEAALADMVAAGTATRVVGTGRQGAGGRFVPSETRTPFDDAREFSRALHDTFSRTFVGAAKQEGAHGYQLPPETMMKRAFASGDEIGALRFRELEEAARFLPKRGLGDAKVLQAAETDVMTMLDAQQKVLRLAADRARDPVTGEVRPERLAAFMRDADELMQRFPEVADDLKAALRAKGRLDDWADRIAGIRRDLDDPAGVLGRVLKVDSPTDAIAGALRSDQPVTRLNEMLKLARGHGPDAVEGLRAGIWAAIFASARRQTGQLGGGEVRDPSAYLDNLLAAVDNPIRSDLPSVANYLAKNKLMGSTDLELLSQFREAAHRVRAATHTLATGEAAIKPTTMLERLLTAAAGSFAARHALEIAAKAMGSSKGALSGPTLIVSGKGSAATNEFVSRLPRLSAQALLIDALAGKPLRPNGQAFSLLELVMQKIKTPGEEVQQTLRLHAYVWASGLLSAEEEMGPPPPRKTAPLQAAPQEGPGLLDRLKETLFGQVGP